MRMQGLVVPFAAALIGVAGSDMSHAQPSNARPFVVGERAEYDVKFGVIHAGTAAVEVTGIDTVRSRAAYGFRLTMSAGVNLVVYKYSVRDTMRSWVDTATLQSLRFNQDQLDGGRARHKRYEIYPERRAFQDGDKPEQPSVADPLDDIAFLFFVRGQRFDVGATETWPRYFKPQSNPVVLHVLRKDTLEVAGRKWPTVVVRPIIKTSSLFAQNGEAQVWISDDPAHVIVQINTKLSVGSITMRLKSYSSPSPAVAPGDSLRSEARKPH
ncbi:MAG TPA: DUF3108 domain-containing protein [Gemmatimonadaceae bacterium]|nr:DUF3108 domain-containing protein [Gemmatimonadaceae bacterium]